MKHEKIGDNARVWVVTRGPDGRLQHQLDREAFEALHPGMAEIADALAEVAETRVW